MKLGHLAQSGLLYTLSTWGFVGCAHQALNVRHTPTDAIERAEARLKERGIPLDPSARGMTRLRTPIVCFREAGKRGFDWDRAFGEIGPGPKKLRLSGHRCTKRCFESV